MHAVSRLLGSAADGGGESAVAETLVAEARRFFRVGSAVLLPVAELEGRPELGPVTRLLGSREPSLRLEGDEAAELAGALGADGATRTALLLPLRTGGSAGHVLVLADVSERHFEAGDLEVARAFADAAAAGLTQLRLAADHAAQVARQAAFARAARMLNESLDVNRVLVRICEEAAGILDADYANLCLGNAAEGLRIEATYGLPPEVIGGHVPVGEGLVGECVERDEPLLGDDSLAVPMHWDGELRGAVAVGYFEAALVTPEQLALLEAFADLAAAACRNASAHAGLVVAARTDALTGCLNHAAMHDSLRRELERCRRTGQSLSLAIVDLDDFKRVNETHGHLAGDEVLRRVGHAMRQAVRAYDLVARYGGDEFAIVAIDAGEHEAAEVASRAIEDVTGAIRAVEASVETAGATAGVAEWQADESPNALIARADRALLYGKQQGSRGVAVRASELLEAFVPEGGGRDAAPPAEHDDRLWPDRVREQSERLRKRTLQLALAAALSARVAPLANAQEIVEAGAEELHRGFECFLAAILRLREDGHLESVAIGGPAAERVEGGHWVQPIESGLIGRCVRERRPVIAGDVRDEPDYRPPPSLIDVRSELCVPIWAGDRLWGAIDIEEVRPDAFDEDDARLIGTVAAQIGSALRAAALLEQLEQARTAPGGAAQAQEAVSESSE